MKVKVKTVHNDGFTIQTEPSQTVADVKKTIQAEHGEERFPSGFNLIFKGKILPDSQTVEGAGITEDAFLVAFVKAKPVAKAAAPKPQPAADATQTKREAGQAAAPAPAPAAAPAAPAATEVPAKPTAAAAGASAMATGPELEESIQAICEMGFAEADVRHAMRAAFCNPERAIEYLTNGIPEGQQPPADPPAAPAARQPDAAATPSQPPAAPTPQAPAAPAAPTPTPAPPVPPAPTGPNTAPLDMWAPSEGAAGGPPAGQGSPADLLAALQNNPALASMLQGDAAAVPQMLSELAQSNPGLLQALGQNPAQLMQALAAGMGMPAGGEEPQGGQVIELTQEENQAIERLQQLGFSRAACIQAYLASEKQEELAANMLLNGGFDD